MAHAPLVGQPHDFPDAATWRRREELARILSPKGWYLLSSWWEKNLPSSREFESRDWLSREVAQFTLMLPDGRSEFTIPGHRLWPLIIPNLKESPSANAIVKRRHGKSLPRFSILIPQFKTYHLCSSTETCPCVPAPTGLAGISSSQLRQPPN